MKPDSNRNAQPPVLLVTPWYGGTHGGVAVATESLAHALIARGGTCVVMRTAPDGLVPHRSLGIADEVIVDICIRDRSFAVGTASQRVGYAMRKSVLEWTLRRLIRTHGIRVAHFHFAIHGFEQMMQSARNAGLVVVTTFHGADVNKTLQDPTTRHLVRDMTLLSDHVTVVSRTLQDRLLAEVPEVAPRLSLVHNVVPTSFARSLETAHAPDRRSGGWDILLVGQLIPRKGGDVLLDALAQVVKELPHTRVAFAGSGPFEGALRSQADRLGLRESVAFLGELSRAQLLDAYQETRILAIPSRSEGLPLVLLEALWIGIPVVASAVDGLPEVIHDGQNGLLVPAEDSLALAQALIRVLADDGLAARISENARDDARRQFAPAVMADRFAGIYSRLISERVSR